MAVDTLLQCFVADEEMFGPGERFASSELTTYVDKNGSHTPVPSPNEGGVVAKTTV